ncbi:MAG: hypothetical protein H7246_20115 [Phycisphaerae bacterium]|nr:hypothetical protein [Saprospiraceae bacterium]
MSTYTNEAQASKRPFLNTILLILLGLALGWLAQYLKKERTPSPTFSVGKDKVVIIPDRTIGADQVTITIFNADKTQLYTTTISVDSSLAFAFPTTDKRALRILQEYLCRGCLIKCCNNDSTVDPDGNPIVVTDVILRTNLTSVPAEVTDPTSNWCNCNWPTTGSPVPGDPNTTTRSFPWGVNTPNPTIPDIRRLTVTDGTNTAILYLKTIGTTTGAGAEPGDHAQYSSAGNFDCNLSPADGFRYVQPDGTTAITPRTAMVKFTGPGTFNFTVKTTRTNAPGSNGLLIEQRVWITCPGNWTVTQTKPTGGVCSSAVE